MDDAGEQASPAGWYPDPSGGEGQRYWDGSAWTDQYAGTADLAVGAAPPAAAGSAWYRRPMFLLPAILVVVAVVAFFVFRSSGDDSGGGGASALEATLAVAVADDLIGKGSKSLGAKVPEQFPKDFPLPADAKVIAAFASASGEDTISVTFTTNEPDPDHFVRDRLAAAGYETSSDFRLSLGTSEETGKCSSLRLTNGFFRDGDLVGLISTSDADEEDNCKATISVAVGPDVNRSGR